MWQSCFQRSFMLIYCPNIYKTKKVYNEDVNDCLEPLKSISDWFVTNKILKKFHDALLSNDDILLIDENFSKVTFRANKTGILSVDLDKINFDDENDFGEIILKLLSISDLPPGVINLKNAKPLKKI